MNTGVDYYKKLYSDNLCPEKLREYEDLKKLFIINDDIATLSEHDRNSIERIITIDECENALKELSLNKSPGCDGIPADFYKYFWSDIRNFVFDSFVYSFENGYLSLDQRRGILILIPKKDKDIRELKNWRPITLLNTDYKILTKALANRLQKVIPNLIHSDQTGYIEGRYIGENIRTITDLIQYTSLKQCPGILLSIDFEKAFDSLRWSFMLDILKCMSFGDYFCKWINIIYTDPLCCVTNNGHASSFVKIERGIRQGCPISALLFILTVELLACAIRKNNNVKGIKIHDYEIKISQLADDTTLFVQDLDSLSVCLEILHTFYLCAGLKVNKSKTIAKWLGCNKANTNKPFGLNWQSGPFKTLGIWFSDNEKLMRKT